MKKIKTLGIIQYISIERSCICWYNINKGDVFVKYKETKLGIEIYDSNISLKETFDCGQCFRFNEIEPNTFVGVSLDKSLKISENGNKITLFDISSKEFNSYWKNYFDLDLDYDNIKKDLSTIHPNLKLACEFAPGIIILRQDPWEALCSFIISQNNNIKRIKGIIETFCKNFGSKIDENFYSFPKAEDIAKLSVDDLSVLKCGFRDKYILDAARKVALSEINLSEISSMPLNEARAELMKIFGVGPKVAECTLLYGMHRTEAFPVDVWMKRALTYLFDDMEISKFGKYAGIAQQYIFHYSRMNSELFKKQ